MYEEKIIRKLLLLFKRINQRRKLESRVTDRVIWSQNMRWSLVLMLELFGARKEPFGANESRIEVECRAFLRQRASEFL